MSGLDEARQLLAELAEEVPEAPGRVVVDLSGEVGIVRFDAPRTRNALTVQMMGQLAAAVEAIGRWEGRAVLLCAEGPAFCAGGHLGQVHAALGTPERGARMARAMGGVLDALFDAPPITVAVVHGPAIGGGAELATACDFRVGGPATRIHFVQGRLGVAAGWGGAGRLTRLLGRRLALTTLLEARPLDAARAMSIGLLDAVGEDPLAEAGALLDGFVGAAAPARALKAQVVAAETLGPRGRDEAAHAFATVWGGPDHRAALDGRRG